MQFKCAGCGFCCTQDLSKEFLKRIPLYPEEFARISDYLALNAREPRKIAFKAIPDLYLPDHKNKRVYVFRYTIALPKTGSCVLRTDDKRCSVYPARPLACQSYPLAIKANDAFSSVIIIDLDCPEIRREESSFRQIDPGTNLAGLINYFPSETPIARRLVNREKMMQMAIRQKVIELGLTDTGVIEWDQILAQRDQLREYKWVDICPD